MKFQKQFNDSRLESDPVDQLLVVLLVVLGSFCAGLMPVVYGLSLHDRQPLHTIPSEGTLWNDAVSEN